MSIFSKPKSAAKYKWPDCESPEEERERGVFGIGMSINGTPYCKKEVEPGKWQWVIDEAGVQFKRDEENRRRDLWWALRSRVLNDEEMEQVRSYGEHLNVREMVSYNATEKALELNDALHKQALLQLAALKG